MPQRHNPYGSRDSRDSGKPYVSRGARGQDNPYAPRESRSYHARPRANTHRVAEHHGAAPHVGPNAPAQRDRNRDRSRDYRDRDHVSVTQSPYAADSRHDHAPQPRRHIPDPRREQAQQPGRPAALGSNAAKSAAYSRYGAGTRYATAQRDRSRGRLGTGKAQTGLRLPSLDVGGGSRSQALGNGIRNACRILTACLRHVRTSTTASADFTRNALDEIAGMCAVRHRIVCRHGNQIDFSV